jgi:PilZ domain
VDDSTGPTEAELTLYRPKRPEGHRRATDRYRCALASAGKLFFPATGETLAAWLTNLSVTGVGLNLPRALEIGLELVIQVRVEEGGELVKLAARVVHATREVDGTWRIGCAFTTALSEDVLEALLWPGNADNRNGGRQPPETPSGG